MVPQYSSILCDIKILSVEEVADQAAIDGILENKTKTFAEIKKSIEVTELRAGYYLSAKSLDNAAKLLQRIVDSVKEVKTVDEKEETDKKRILLQAMTNLTVCKNKQEDWQGALDYVKMIEAFVSIEKKPKLLFVKGCALMEVGETAEALILLEKAQKLAFKDDAEDILAEVIKECKKRLENTQNDSLNEDHAKNLKSA